jgi:hypothetical protein
MNKRKKIFAGLLVGTAVFGAVYASAASLGVTTTTLGAGGTNVAACDPDGVAASYTTAYNTTGGAGYKLSGASVTGVAAACQGLAYSVTVTGAEGAALHSWTGTVPSSGTSISLSGGNDVPAATITGVYVVISG